MKFLRCADLRASLFLLLLVFLFLWRVLLGGRVLLPLDVLYAIPPWQSFAAEMGIPYPHNDLIGDLAVQNYGWKQLVQESYAQGKFPLWNPYVFSGMPFLAAGQYGALYPPGVLFLLMPLAQAYGWFTALHLWLGGLFLYAFLRVLGASWRGGLVGASAFMLSSFLVVSFLWPQVVSTAIWAPFLLLAIALMVRSFAAPGPVRWSRALLWGLVGSLGVALQFLAGHLEISFYVLFTAGLYTLFRLVLLGRARSPWYALGAGGFALGMVVLGTGLAAMQLIPFLELIRENYRAGLVSYEQVVGYALPQRHLLALLMPDVFGNPSHHGFFNVLEGRWEGFTGASDAFGNPKSYPFWGIKNYVEGAAYMGILPLLLGAVALLVRRDRWALFFAGYGLFSLLLAFGTPLYALFFFGVPGFDQLHTPFRWLFPYSLSIAILAGLGTETILGLSREAPGRRVALAIGGGTSLLGMVLLALLVASRVIPGPALGLAAELLGRSASLARAFSDPVALYSYQARNVLLLAMLLVAGGLLLRLCLRRPPALWAPWGLIGLVSADLFFFGYDFNTAADPRLLDFQPPAIAFLKEQQRRSPPFRVVTFNYDDTLRPNTAMLVGLQDVRGYDTVILRRYVNFWRLLEEPQGLLYSQINKLVEARSLESPLLDLLNVRYVLTTQNIDLPGYREVYRGEINIYENEEVLPRAFVVFTSRRVGSAEETLALLRDPTFDLRRNVILEGGPLVHEAEGVPPTFPPQATITHYEPNEVRLRVPMPQPGYLVLTDAYFPGWRAFVRDQELPVGRAYSIFRAVPLTTGEHEVVLSYRPESFRLGAFISGLSVVLFVLGLAVVGWQRISGQEMEASTLRRIAKNSLTPMAAQVFNRAMDLGFTIFMLRYLGPLNAGKYAFAVFLIGYFAILSDFGLGTLLTREVARTKEEGPRYVSNTLVLRLVLLVASLPLLLGVVALYWWRFDLTGDTALTIALFAVSLIPSNIAAALSALFSAHEKMEYPAAMTIVTNLIRVGGGVTVLLLGWGIVGLAVVSILASTVTALLFGLLVLRLFFRPSLAADAALQREMLGTSAPLMINNLLSTIFFRIDVMLLKPMKGDEANGFYTTAYKFIDALNIIPSLFTLAIFPLLSRYAASSQEALLRAFRLSLKALLIVGCPITVGTTLIAEPLILLLFGPSFAPAILALQILIWFLPFSYINSVTHYVLIAVNQQRFLTLAFFIGATFNFVANLLVIPTYSFAGAAFVTILSELMLMVPFFYAVHRHVGAVPLLQIAWRPALASLAMGALLLPLQHLSMVVTIPLGAVVYGALLFALRTFTEEDRALVRALRQGA